MILPQGGYSLVSLIYLLKACTRYTRERPFSAILLTRLKAFVKSTPISPLCSAAAPSTCLSPSHRPHGRPPAPTIVLASASLAAVNSATLPLPRAVPARSSCDPRIFYFPCLDRKILISEITQAILYELLI